MYIYFAVNSNEYNIGRRLETTLQLRIYVCICHTLYINKNTMCPVNALKIQYYVVVTYANYTFVLKLIDPPFCVYTF